jgi:hypothetical protein
LFHYDNIASLVIQTDDYMIMRVMRWYLATRLALFQARYAKHGRICIIMAPLLAFVSLNGLNLCSTMN